MKPALLILLHPDDNVFVCTASIRAGDILVIDDQPVLAVEAIDIGHKVARYDLRVGDSVLKYGAPIGSVTSAVAKGGHVHLHNMGSNYIASHTRQTVGAQEK